MNAAELTSTLSKMYFGSPEGESATMVHLFGIRFADEIRDCGASVTDITNSAGLPYAYHSEVYKGMKLAKYVDIKASFTPPPVAEPV